jgi:hypothetical protein
MSTVVPRRTRFVARRHREGHLRIEDAGTDPVHAGVGHHHVSLTHTES